MEYTEEIKAEKHVTKSGRSFVINVTTELKLMGLKPGDSVGVTLKRCKDDNEGREL